MTTEANKASARRMVDEVVNRGNLALIDELMAPDFVDHALPPGVPPNREGVKTFFAMLRGAFPDLHATVDDVIAEGDKVVQRTTAHGTMKGEFAGMPPSGKSATWQQIHILRFADGKEVEHWAVTDQLSMLQQLGFAEAPGQPADVAG
jgi:Predicted ester cyclase